MTPVGVAYTAGKFDSLGFYRKGTKSAPSLQRVPTPDSGSYHVIRHPVGVESNFLCEEGCIAYYLPRIVGTLNTELH